MRGVRISGCERRPEGTPHAIAQIVHGVGSTPGNTAGSAAEFGVLGEGGWAQLVVDRHDQAGLGDVSLRMWQGLGRRCSTKTNRGEIVAELIDWLRERPPR